MRGRTLTLRHWIYRQPLYRASLGGRVPARLSELTVSVRPGDTAVGEAIAGGKLPWGGHRLAFDDELWARADDDPALARRLHGFGWLGDVAATSRDDSWTAARTQVGRWIERYDRWHALVWRADILGARLHHWLHHGTRLLTLDAGFGELFLASAVAQARHLGRVVERVPPDEDGLAAVQGLLAAGLLLPGGETRVTRALAVLQTWVDRQVHADGGHAARAPDRQLAVLDGLVGVRALLMAEGREVPGFVQNAIDRMAPMLRLYRHGDGRLALFNGAVEGDEILIERVLADIQIVQREEFDVVRDMASMARTENEALRARIAELEARLDAVEAKPASAAKKKAAAKSSTLKK